MDVIWCVNVDKYKSCICAHPVYNYVSTVFVGNLFFNFPNLNLDEKESWSLCYDLYRE